jgi:hypothetical protein
MACAGGDSQGPAPGDLGNRGARLTKAGETLGVTVEAIARGGDRRFIPVTSVGWLNDPSPG